MTYSLFRSYFFLSDCMFVCVSVIRSLLPYDLKEKTPTKYNCHTENILHMYLRRPFLSVYAHTQMYVGTSLSFVYVGGTGRNKRLTCFYLFFLLYLFWCVMILIFLFL